MIPPTKIPTLAALGEELGFGKSKNRLLNDLTDSTHHWRRQHTCSNGSSGADLLDWKNDSTQVELKSMTLKYLNEGAYGKKWWPQSTDIDADGQPLYDLDKKRVVELLKMIFWRQNLYSSRNAKYCDAKRQREDGASSHESVSAEDEVSVSWRPQLAPKQAENNPKRHADTSTHEDPHGGPRQRREKTKSTASSHTERPFKPSLGPFHNRTSVARLPQAGEISTPPTALSPRNYNEEIGRSRFEGTVPSHVRPLSDATTITVRENQQSGEEDAVAPHLEHGHSHLDPSSNVLMLKYRKPENELPTVSGNGSFPRSDTSLSRFSTPDLSFVQEFFASNDNEEGRDGDHPVVIQEDGVTESFDTPRRSSKRKRTQHWIPGAASKMLYEEATRSDEEEDTSPVVAEPQKRTRSSNSFKKKRRVAPNSVRRARPSKNQPSTKAKAGNDHQLERRGQTPETDNRLLPQSREITVMPTASENQPGRESTKGETKASSATSKPVIDLCFFFVKARKPRLAMQRWPEGKFRDKTVDFVFEAALRITERRKIDQLKCTLLTAEKELTEVLQRDSEDGFVKTKKFFNEEMTSAFKKNRNELKDFEIYLEPIDDEDLTRDGNSEVEDAVMGFSEYI